VASDTSSPRVEAYDTSSPRVVASGTSSPSVEAYGTSSPSVEAYDYASVVYAGRGGALSLFGHATLRNGGHPDGIAQSGENTTHLRVPLTTQPGAVRGMLTRIENNPQEWEQGSWAVETACGTAYCAAGHALLEVGARIDIAGQSVEVATLPDHVRRRFLSDHVSIATGAQAVLGISTHTADRLFAGGNTLPQLRDLVAEICAGAETTDAAPTAAAE
jgi:hypothetical protein